MSSIKKPHSLSILFSISSFLPERGGLQIATYTLARELLRRNHNCAILTPKREKLKKYEQINGINVYRCECFSDYLKLINIFKNYDLLINIEPTIHPFILYLKIRYGIPMCLFIWGTASEKAPKYRKVFSGVIADLLIADSEYAKNSFGLFKEKMVVEPLGTDIPILCKRRIRKNATTILTVARYDPRKNLETLLKAMKIVVTSHPEVQLIIVGGQTFKGKPNIYRQHIFKLIKHLDLEDKVKIIEDVSRTELFQIYKFSDIFVSSSTHEMFGLVLVEAMVSGLPIIATNATAIPEVVKQAGILIPPKRPNLLATTIIKLLQDFKLRKELSVIAMKRAKKFTAGQMYKRYFKWFAWLTKHR